MPRCKVCGKSFATLDALEQHHRTVHPKVKYMGPKKELPRHFYSTIFVIAIFAIAGVSVLIYLQTPHTKVNNSILGTPISQAFYNNLTGVNDATLNSVRNVSLTYYPVPISDQPLNKSGLPEVLYIGGEFCPYCAAERWSLTIALSKFGNISGLQYMLSGANDLNLSTVSYKNVSYSSRYISFVAVEAFDRSSPPKPLQSPTPEENALWQKYSPQLGVPFIDIAGRYVILSSQFDPNLIKGLSWEQIYSQLNNPNSTVARQIDAAADVLITIFCQVDGNQPASVCSQPYAHSPISLHSSSDPVASLKSALLAPDEARYEL